MYLGDNLLRDGINALVGAFREHEPEALILLTRVPDPWHYGVAELDGGRVTRLVEKPKDPPSDMALVGVYMFTPAIFQAARAIEPSWRDELEITDAIQQLIDGGNRVESHTVSGWWKDTGQLADMLEANRLVLEDVERRMDGNADSESRVEGRVAIEAGAKLERSVVRGPAIIGAGARVVDSYVGPYTSIDRDVEIVGSEVEHSILLAGASVRDLETRIEASLLGRNVSLSRTHEMPKTLRMIVGDNSQVLSHEGPRRRRRRGMLGRDTTAAIAARGHSVRGLSRAELDITRPADVEHAIGALRPDVVVNCAAWTDVDGAEASAGEAMRVNDTAAALVAATAPRTEQASSTSPATTSSTGEAGSVRRIGPAGRDLGVRPLQAGG